MSKAHQKELQKNDLEMGLEKVASAVRPYYAPLALLVCVLIVGSIGYMIYERSVQASNSAAWSKWSLAVFDRDSDSERLRKVSEDLGKTPASLWAKQLAADQDLNEGAYLIYDDRDLAQSKLESALGLYQDVIKEAGSDLMLLTRARFGAARANECLFKVDAAVDMYQQIVDSEMGASALAKAAKEKIDALKKPETKEWYKWFATTEPVKPLPNKNASGGLKSFPNLPDVPDISVPGLGDPAVPKTGDKPPATEEQPPKTGLEETTPPPDREDVPSRFEDKGGEPKPEEKKPEETKPEEAKPAEETPKAEEKPAEEKPAEPKPEEGKP